MWCHNVALCAKPKSRKCSAAKLPGILNNDACVSDYDYLPDYQIHIISPNLVTKTNKISFFVGNRDSNRYFFIYNSLYINSESVVTMSLSGFSRNKIALCVSQFGFNRKRWGHASSSD
jgi:hypothetical protein